MLHAYRSCLGTLVVTLILFWAMLTFSIPAWLIIGLVMFIAIGGLSRADG